MMNPCPEFVRKQVRNGCPRWWLASADVPVSIQVHVHVRISKPFPVTAVRASPNGGKTMRQVGTESGVQQATVDLALLVLRIVAGLVFFMHGYQKLFDNGISATQTGFDGMGAPLPDITAVIVTFLELVGGLALMAGVLTRVFAMLLAIDMIAAFFIVHVENGFFAMNGGVELVLLLAGVAAALAIAGPGAYAVDSVMNLAGRTTRSQGALTARRA
jgi:putative oxidoreductase